MKFTNPKKIYHGILRRLHRLFKLHPVSSPYISGDTFRNLADHIHDMDSSINTKDIKNNDILFVQSPKLKEFFENIHPHIKNRYILITHNGDENITEEYLPYVTETITHWFAQNCLVSHPKITPIPIGLENKWYYLHGIPSYFDKLKKEKAQKKDKILYKFSVSTNPPERGEAMKVLEKSPLAETYADWRESLEYLTTLKNFAFVASPAGNGHDCHRTWEAMYLGTIPIIKKSIMSEHFRTLGLPIVIINAWSKIEELTEEQLRSLYDTLSPHFESPALWSDYWVELIKSKKYSE